MSTRWRIVNTWNGGAGGRVVCFTSEAGGDAGHNECFAWMHQHTPFSFSEATTNQGYVVEPVDDAAEKRAADKAKLDAAREEAMADPQNQRVLAELAKR